MEAGRFEPIVEQPRYSAPRRGIDPDTAKGWLRRLLPIVLARRRSLVLSLGAAVLAMLATVAAPAVTQRAIDNALIAKTSSLSTYLWVLGGLALARGVFAMAYRYGLFALAYRIEADLRTIVISRLSAQSFSFFDRVQSGQLISRANSDIRSVQMFLAFAPLMAVSLLSFVVALCVMLSIHVGLTAVAVLALPGVYLLGVRLREQIFPLSWVVQARTADVATIVDENLNGMLVVKSFAAEQAQLETLARAARRLRWANVATADARARWAPMMENLPRVGLMLVLLYGGYLVNQGQIEIGAIVAFSAYVVLLQTPFRLLGFFMMMAQRAAASAQRIFEVLDEDVAVVDPPDPVHLLEPRGAIEFEGVTFGYDAEQPVLRDTSFRVHPGETVALVGRTGCGKSTVARLLTRCYDVDAGAVRVDGHDVRTLSLVSLRAAIGTVADDPFLFSASVRENIAFERPGATEGEVVAAARAAAAHDFISDLPEGYDTVIGERGSTLSGGQRQRVALARALLAAKSILVLDDATSAIDAHVEQQIHDALSDSGQLRTTLLIAHRLSTIAQADRVLLFEDGAVIADGTHVDLLASEPRYSQVLAQVTAEKHDMQDEMPDEDDQSWRRRIAGAVLDPSSARGGSGAPGPLGPLGGLG